MLDVFEMSLKSLVVIGEVFNDLGVLENNMFDIEDHLLMEGFFQSCIVGSLVPRDFSLGLSWGVKIMIGFVLLNVWVE